MVISPSTYTQWLNTFAPMLTGTTQDPCTIKRFLPTLTKTYNTDEGACLPGMLFPRCLNCLRIMNADPMSTKKDTLLSLIVASKYLECPGTTETMEEGWRPSQSPSSTGPTMPGSGVSWGLLLGSTPRG